MPDDENGAAAGGRLTGLLGLVTGVVEVLGLAAFAAVIVVTLLQVLARYLQISLTWTEELARILFLAAMMASIAVSIHRREHIVVDFLFARWAPRTRAGMSIIFDAATLLLLAIWLDGARRLLTLNSSATFISVPWIPVPALYGVEAAAIALMMVLVFADLLVQVRTYKSGSAA